MTQTEHEHEQEIKIPVPTPQHVENVIEKTDETIPHVIQHEGRIVHLEETQAQNYATLLQQIEDTKNQIRTDLEHARTEQATALEARLAALEEKALAAESTVVEAPTDVLNELEAAPTEAVELVPEVEKIPQKIEPRGIRARRKARHKR